MRNDDEKGFVQQLTQASAERAVLEGPMAGDEVFSPAVMARHSSHK